ncbi:uncharacterized mitochondrial protein AtMg00860-like [Solanum lycopersicum]|uniref:uncharacterized mitochondrial protein AtMg00860-like n=1 Tax=Solanum lycopersicum TaxID=4081 RepID=UPI003747C03D
MYFGLTNAPAAFMDLLNRVFLDYLNLFVIVFIADIFIYYKNENKHESHLRLALQVLKQHQLYAKFSKCEFWLTSIAFVGHVISCEGVEVDLKKMDAVRNWPILLTPIDIRSFLGLAGPYRRFIDGFSSISSPFISLSQKKVKFEWSEACEKGFQDLKDKLTSAPLLTLPKDINTTPVPYPLEFTLPSKNIFHPGYDSDKSSPTNNTFSFGKYILSGSYPSSTGFSAR